MVVLLTGASGFLGAECVNAPADFVALRTALARGARPTPEMVAAPAVTRFVGSGGGYDDVAPYYEEAGRIARLWWIFFWVCLSVYIVTIAVVLIAAVRRHTTAAGPTPPNLAPEPKRERAITHTVIGAVASNVIGKPVSRT